MDRLFAVKNRQIYVFIYLPCISQFKDVEERIDIKPAMNSRKEIEEIWSPSTVLMLNRRRSVKKEYELYYGETCLTFPLSS